MDRTPYDGGNGASLKAKRGGLGDRRSGTPYQRPLSGRHAPAGRQQAALAKSVASGIVDSASRILSKGAAYLFTSLFKKRQAPAIAATEHWVPRPEADDAVDEDIPPLELAPDENAADMPDRVEESSGSGRRDSLAQDGDVQLEDILKQSNLSREQLERYINLLKSKVAARDPSADDRDDSRLVIYGQNSVDPLAAVSLSDTHQPDLGTYEPARAPWERNERPSEPQIKRPARPSNSRWTPLQTPISGGRELLKSRVPLTDESGPARGMKDRGTVLRKLQGEVDLSCFHKDTKASLGSAISSIPKQSTRTARKIMDSLDQKSLKSRPLVRRTFAEAKGTRFSKTTSTSPLASLTDPGDRVMMQQHEPRSKRKVTEENVNNGETSTWHENTVKTVRFSFPSTPGPEPPTPKPMPVFSSTPISGNGDFVRIGSSEASPSLSNLASSSTPNGTSVAAAEDEAMSNLVARAEKVSSLLNRATTSPTLTKTVTRISDDANGTSGKTSQDHMKPTANGFYAFAGAAAAGFTGAGRVTDEDPYPSDQGTAAANPFLIGTAKVSATSFYVDAQSLAPPETSNNPFAAAPTLRMTKSLGKIKKKLSKRIR